MSATLPPPDFGFWLGPETPFTLLIDVTPERIPAAGIFAPLTSVEELATALERNGQLLDASSLNRALDASEYVLFTHSPQSVVLPSILTSGFTVLIDDGPRRLLRRRR